MSKILLHWRKDSGELEVFEAANYFSEANDHQISCLNNAFTFSHKLIRESCCNNQAWRSSGRMSLDMSVAIRHSSTPFAAPQIKQGTSSSVQIMEKPAALKQKCKQPNSPGGRLTSCLNTLFYLTVSSNKKKKKKNKKLISAMKDDNEDELNGSTLSNTAHNTTTSSSYPSNPRNSCKDSHIPEKGLEFTSESPERSSVHHWADKYPSEENEHRKLDDGDGEGDSDCSSDLFDLPHRELLDCYSTGLPVYEI
ncbi:protein BIG GRAIN 1-like E [Ipomoea triloba]|uniref:protein BIG GRAIN 1-like E n=1 Tax=Ipomoea triloba TaxID=35885 RepID=UPI00125E1724|nr:protein BIG GRAIN 1-like E [Ipomoea triloba]